MELLDLSGTAGAHGEDGRHWWRPLEASMLLSHCPHLRGLFLQRAGLSAGDLATLLAGVARPAPNFYEWSAPALQALKLGPAAPAEAPTSDTPPAMELGAALHAALPHLPVLRLLEVWGLSDGAADLLQAAWSDRAGQLGGGVVAQAARGRDGEDSHLRLWLEGGAPAPAFEELEVPPPPPTALAGFSGIEARYGPPPPPPPPPPPAPAPAAAGGQAPRGAAHAQERAPAQHRRPAAAGDGGARREHWPSTTGGQRPSLTAGRVRAGGLPVSPLSDPDPRERQQEQRRCGDTIAPPARPRGPQPPHGTGAARPRPRGDTRPDGGRDLGEHDTDSGGGGRSGDDDEEKYDSDFVDDDDDDDDDDHDDAAPSVRDVPTDDECDDEQRRASRRSSLPKLRKGQKQGDVVPDGYLSSDEGWSSDSSVLPSGHWRHHKAAQKGAAREEDEDEQESEHSDRPSAKRRRAALIDDEAGGSDSSGGGSSDGDGSRHHGRRRGRDADAGDAAGPSRRPVSSPPTAEGLGPLAAPTGGRPLTAADRRRRAGKQKKMREEAEARKKPGRLVPFHYDPYLVAHAPGAHFQGPAEGGAGARPAPAAGPRARRLRRLPATPCAGGAQARAT